jgi:hypothetical protein
MMSDHCDNCNKCLEDAEDVWFLSKLVYRPEDEVRAEFCSLECAHHWTRPDEKEGE